MTIDPSVSTGMDGRRGTGNPCGNGPSTDIPVRAARSKTATMMVAAVTAMRMPGTRGHRFSTRISASAPPPIASATMFVLADQIFSTMPSTWRTGPGSDTENPRSLGIWLSTTVSAMPFM
jgi:hypothetical protein